MLRRSSVQSRTIRQGKGKTMSKQYRDVLIAIYLDYKNDYLTPETFADHNGLHVDQAQRLIDLGRDVFNSAHPDA